MSRDIYMPITIDDIDIPAGRREVNAAAVKKLADSIDQIGLRHPITVREKGDRYVLVAGRHRLEAYRKMEIEHIPAVIVKMTNDEARLWEIAENLHRAELTNLEKAESIEEWRTITERQVRNGSAPSQPKEAGVRKTAEALGVDEKTVRNAEKIASILPEAKQVAVEVGVDSIRDLVEVSKEQAERQVAKVHELAAHRANKVDGDVKQRAAREVADIIAEYVPGEVWDAVKANLYAAGAANIANELTNITGQSIMDGRYK
jgi:ParB-like chromosome segregation protein Spo0J